MIRIRRPAALAALLCVAAAGAAGCGIGAGEGSEGVATLTVTRDYGSDRLLAASTRDPAASETVVRFLDREAEIETRYGGNFVSSIEGQGSGGGRDWFFYVNGNWSPIGAGEARVRPGDRIWWDLREWSDVYRVPAVVGSWPEPFVHGFDGERHPVDVRCLGGGEACETVADRLREEGAEVGSEEEEEEVEEGGLRLLVGPWERVRADRAAASIEDGPEASGVFARFDRAGSGWELVLLDPRAEAAETLGAGAGLVAATRRDEQPATWVVSGTDRQGVERAAGALDAASLADRYAVAVRDGAIVPVPRDAGQEASR